MNRYIITEAELLRLLRAKHELALLKYYHADKGIDYDTVPPGYSENYYKYTGRKDLEKYKLCTAHLLP